MYIGHALRCTFGYKPVNFEYFSFWRINVVKGISYYRDIVIDRKSVV